MSKSLVSALVAAAVALTAAATLTDASRSQASAATSMSCTIPNSVSCTITSTKGLRSVLIKANTPLGVIDLVNKTYRGCPKSVKVSWDSAYHSSSTKFVECASAKLKLNSN
ncbi:hypothetical protein [Jiella sonneratiae]|nr:hypothetical protein [Jiella sonneratiae]